MQGCDWRWHQIVNTQKMKLTAEALIPTKKPKQKDWIDTVVGCARAATVWKAVRPLSVADLRMQLRSAPKEKRLWRWNCCLFSFLTHLNLTLEMIMAMSKWKWIEFMREHGKLCVETQGWKHSVKKISWKINYATEQMICMMLPSTRFGT